MNRIKLLFVLLFVVKNTLAIANIKSSPISINDKPDLSKSGDLKVEEARFRDPMPEYYEPRDRNNFVTSYGGSSNYGYSDRYGLKYNSDRDRYNPSNRYGTTSPTILDSKYYIPGGMYNQPRDPYAPNGLYNPSYTSKYPYDNYAHNYGSSYSPNSPNSWDLDMGKGNGKSLWLPLAGVALLGAAAVLASNPMILHMGTMYGKRKRRSVNDLKNEAQKIAYRGHQQT